MAERHRSGYQLANSELEDNLRMGEEGASLREYFGGELYEELSALSAKVSRLRERRSCEVLVVPGFLGSKLGREGTLFDEVIWLDPLGIKSGAMDRLAFEREPLAPLGAVLLAYLPAKLGLALRGWPTELWAYDWRASVEESARKLCKRVAESRAEEVHLVGHSMGGLVARRARQMAPERLGRVVTVGTPHHGAFATVQLLRGRAPLLHRLALLDPGRDACRLAREVFHSFPGVFDLLPRGPLDPEGSLLDPTSWPEDLCPDPSRLGSANEGPAQLPARDAGVYVIVGTGNATVVAVERGGPAEGLRYRYDESGDGTVPTRSAALAEAPTWFTSQGHGAMLAAPDVVAAVAEILDSGETTSLPQRVEEVPRGAGGASGGDGELRSRSDADLEEEFRSLVETLEDAEDLGDARRLAREFIGPLR